MLGTLLVVTLAGDTNAEPVWDTLNPRLPDFLVQLWIDADIFGTHFLVGEGLDLFDGLGGALLEGNTMDLEGGVSRLNQLNIVCAL